MTDNKSALNTVNAAWRNRHLLTIDETAGLYLVYYGGDHAKFIRAFQVSWNATDHDIRQHLLRHWHESDSSLSLKPLIVLTPYGLWPDSCGINTTIQPGGTILLISSLAVDTLSDDMLATYLQSVFWHILADPDEVVRPDSSDPALSAAMDGLYRAVQEYNAWRQTHPQIMHDTHRISLINNCMLTRTYHAYSDLNVAKADVDLDCALHF